MKFTTSILALALGAQATLVSRDLATIQKVLNDVSTQTDAVDTAVKSFSGDIGPLTAASTKLTSLIQSGTTTVVGTAPLPLQDAATVSQSVTGLNTSAAGLINDLIAKKSAVIAAGKGGTVLKSLQDQRTASKALADAITSKVPDALQPVAKQLSQGIDDSIASGIAAYNGLTDTTPSGGSGSSSSGPASPSAPPSSSVDHHASSTPAPTGGSPTSAAPSKGSAAPTTSGKPAVSTNTAINNGVNVILGALAVVLAF